MRVTDARPNAVSQAAPAKDASAISDRQLTTLFGDIDLGLFPSGSDVCALLGQAAMALAKMFSPSSDGDLGSIVDFGDQTGDAGSIVDFGDQKHPGGAATKSTGDHGSIVDFGDKDPQQ